MSRVENFEEKLKKFSSKWKSAKPGSKEMKGTMDTWLKAAHLVDERKQEFQELEKMREALM